MGRTQALILAAMLSACDKPGAVADAPPVAADAASSDADLVDFAFTGTLLDWDSTASSVVPIANAVWTATYDSSRVATTDANGVFTIRLASYTPLLDVVMPPSSDYAIDAIAIAPPAVFYAGGTFTARAMTTTRVTTFYASVGEPFDATKGALLVHVDGEPRTVSITGDHAAAQAFDGSTWAPGASGQDVFFPNIALGGDEPMTTVTTTGALGTGSVPLAPGKLTYMAIKVD
jgi:hypothetical protein